MTRTNDSIEVITSVERRRRYPASEKKSIVEETYAPGASVSEVARRHSIAPGQVFRWRKAMEQGALVGVSAEDSVVPISEMRQLQQRIRQLERVLGQKTVEVEILKEAVRVGREKKLISRQPLAGLEDFE